MTLSPEEGARKLYELFYGPMQPEKKTMTRKPHGQQPLPYRHKLIGVASIEEIKERHGLSNKVDPENTLSLGTKAGSCAVDVTTRYVRPRG